MTSRLDGVIPATYAEITYCLAFEARTVWSVHPEAINTPLFEFFVDHPARSGRVGRRYAPPGTQLLGWSELRRDARPLPPGGYVRRIFCVYAGPAPLGAVDVFSVLPGRRPRRQPSPVSMPWETAA